MTIPPEIRDAYCEKYGYDPASGMTKNQFILARLARRIKEDALEHIASKAAEISRVSELNRLANAEIIIT